jgi:hypothetical protein
METLLTTLIATLTPEPRRKALALVCDHLGLYTIGDLTMLQSDIDLALSAKEWVLSVSALQARIQLSALRQAAADYMHGRDGPVRPVHAAPSAFVTPLARRGGTAVDGESRCSIVFMRGVSRWLLGAASTMSSLAVMRL